VPAYLKNNYYLCGPRECGNRNFVKTIHAQKDVAITGIT